jgi:hypothetical protein
MGKPTKTNAEKPMEATRHAVMQGKVGRSERVAVHGIGDEDSRAK